MNSESTSNIQRTQSGKPTSYKRAHRAKHAVLVKEQDSATSVEEATLIAEEAQPATQIAVEEQSAISEERGSKQEGPRFFSSVNRAEKVSDQPKADPIAARLARALRGKSADGPKEKETSKENKGVIASSRSAAAPARPKSGFKMKYIWGMMIYLLLADFLGVWIQSWMKAHGLDAVVFQISTFEAYRSTLIFLALLIIILILMARFDLIPRSLGAAMNGSSTTGKSTSGTRPTFESREPQPTIKQGVQGDHDELYREYRQNQRYFQKRDRKR